MTNIILTEEQRRLLRARLFQIKYPDAWVERIEDKKQRIKCIQNFLVEHGIQADAETVFQKLNSFSLPCG